MSPIWCAGVISLRAAVPLRTLLLTWHLHPAPDLQVSWHFPAGCSWKQHKCSATGDWCQRLQVQPNPVTAESRARGSLQVSLHPVGNVWPSQKCVLGTMHSAYLRGGSVGSANPVLSGWGGDTGRRPLGSSFLLKETWCRDKQPVHSVADVSVLGPPLALSWLQTLCARLCSAHQSCWWTWTSCLPSLSIIMHGPPLAQRYWEEAEV